MQIGSRIRSLRELTGMQQQELCSILDIEQSTLANYESGRRIPNDEIKIKIANYFNVTLDYLFDRDMPSSDPEHKKAPSDLKEVLEEPMLMFEGELVTETDKEVLKQMLIAMREAKKKLEKKARK